MRQRQQIWLNGRGLAEAHPKILVQHIEEAAPQMSQKTQARAAGNGLFMTANDIERREITAWFAIREALDYRVRAEAMDAANRWASEPGWLEAVERPGQHIYVQATAFAALGKLREWTEDYPIRFTAYWPYWIDITPARASAEGTSGEITLGVPGTAETAVELTVTPTAGTLSTATITVDDGDSITLADLAIPADTALRIWMDERHLLRITSEGAGLLSKRTATSSDLLRAMPGGHTIAYSADTACAWTFEARGAYL